MEAACPSRTASGAQVCKHHTLMVLSQDPAAIMVFSWLTAISEISAAWPRSVASKRPSSVPQILTRQSSEPWGKWNRRNQRRCKWRLLLHGAWAVMCQPLRHALSIINWTCHVEKDFKNTSERMATSDCQQAGKLNPRHAQPWRFSDAENKGNRNREVTRSTWSSSAQKPSVHLNTQ